VFVKRENPVLGAIRRTRPLRGKGIVKDPKKRAPHGSKTRGIDEKGSLGKKKGEVGGKNPR